MSVVVAVHGSLGFAARWRSQAVGRGYELREVNGYEDGILDRLAGADVFLWQLNHDQAIDLEHARSILEAARQKGVRVFPNHATCWHFDDKVAQKYLLEAIGAPLARTWVFYSARDAVSFTRSAEYPLVFKLRRGAGSLNVRRVDDRNQAERLVRQMFGFGQRPYPVLERIQRGTARARSKDPAKDPFLVRASRAGRFFLQQTFLTPRERGYVLFQRFLPGNDHDIRVTVIGDRAFTFIRGVRPDDFRASGSGRISYVSPPDLPLDAIQVAFGISRALGFQCMAYDFVREPSTSVPVLLEISYSFQAKAVHDCPGYVDRSLQWHEGSLWPEDLILEDLVTAGAGEVR